jgi:hypothetical protein
MKGRLVFLLEEPSMKVLLDGLLPRLFPGWLPEVHFKCVPHEGKSDLDKSIPIKLRSWRIPNDRFVIVRDNDNADCITLKARLIKLCQDNARPDTLIRLVCQELESWYIGDLAALAAAYPNQDLDTARYQKKFAQPDTWQKPSVELGRLVKGFQKISGARLIAQYLTRDANKSHSFRVFVIGVQRVAQQMA